MRRPVGSGAAALVVDLGGRQVPVSEERLDLGGVDPGHEQQRGRGCSQRMGRIAADSRYRPIAPGYLMRGARQFAQTPPWCATW